MKRFIHHSLCLGVILLLAHGSTWGQYDHQPVLPDLEGDELYTALVLQYKPQSVLSYGEARDTFLRNIDARDGIVSCVYTGYEITLDQGADPTEDAFDKGINTEHTYPRSKGALENTNGFSDMHHLFPTRVNVNADRGVLPFGEIVDIDTDWWYRDEDKISSIPSDGIADYSELDVNEAFEPREEHKGDVARAIFYFYTMYRTQAIQEDAAYFDLQVEDLCEWHFTDEVDEKEWSRSQKIAQYQDGKPNPFVLDCRLARLYCDEIQGYCLTVATDHERVDLLTSYPNPASHSVQISGAPSERFLLYDQLGRIYSVPSADGMLDVQNLPRGLYFVIFLDHSDLPLARTSFIKL